MHCDPASQVYPRILPGLPFLQQEKGIDPYDGFLGKVQGFHLFSLKTREIPTVLTGECMTFQHLFTLAFVDSRNGGDFGVCGEGLVIKVPS